MKSLYEEKYFKLNNAAVDDISEAVSKFCEKNRVEKKSIAGYRLTIEELLLQWMDKFGDGTSVMLSMGRRWRKPYIELVIAGETFDPFQDKQEEIGRFGNSMLRTIGMSPEYTYDHGRNTYVFRLKHKRRNPIATLTFTLAAAFIAGFGGMLLPEAFRNFTLNSLILPVYDSFFDLLGFAAGPMIFLSVTWGIYGIGDTTTLSRIGKNMIFCFAGTLFGAVLVGSALTIPLYDLNFAGTAQGTDGVESILRLLLGVIPKNLFGPFIDGNSLQIIFMGFVVGIALLFLGKQTQNVAIIVEQINYIVQFLMEFISALVPYFVFIALVNFIWSDTISIIFGVLKLFIIYIGLVALMVVCLVMYTSIRQKVNPVLLISKGLPTLLIALTTASSAASFGTNMMACEKKYGIDNSVTSFGIPLGMVMYKPTTALGYLTFALFFSEMYNVECSVTWLITVLLVVSILAIATPPIPGGAMTAYTIIFMQLGIPLEALSIALAIDVIVDFVDTGFDQFVLPFALIGQASKIGRINLETLRKAQK